MKKYISAVLATAMILVVICIPSSALRGRWDSIIWEIKDGTLTVSGGDIPASAADAAAPWQKFAYKVTNIVLGDDVKQIGDRAFEDMDCALSAELGNAEKIGEMAFSGCTALVSVTVPDTVTKIGDHAFAECTSLKRVTLSASVTFIGEGVWEACPALEQISGGSADYYTDGGVLLSRNDGAVVRYPAGRSATVYKAPDGITAVADGAFRDAVMLESVDLGGVTSVGDGSFYGCTSLEDIALPSAVTVGRAAFFGCGRLRTVSFGAGIESIGDNAFSYCSELASADFSGDAPVASDSIFEGCGNGLTVLAGEGSVGFGDVWLGYPVVRHGVYSGEVSGILWSLDTASGVLSLSGSGAVPDFAAPADAPWYSYRGLISSLDTDGITGIGANSFRDSALRQVELSAEVTFIGDNAFTDCAHLEGVFVKQAASIGREAFAGCTALDTVILGKNAPTLGERAFEGSGALIVYPADGNGYGTDAWAAFDTEAYTAGDANGDGTCNLADVSVLLMYIAKWDVELYRVSADTNVDGALNLADVSLMLMHIAKWDIDIGIEF